MSDLSHVKADLRHLIELPAEQRIKICRHDRDDCAAGIRKFEDRARLAGDACA